MSERNISLVNDLLSSKWRLSVMAMLSGGDEYDFPALKRELDMTDGNLSSHMAKLIDGGLVGVTKTGRGKASRTVYRITTEGRAAWEEYIEFLREILTKA